MEKDEFDILMLQRMKYEKNFYMGYSDVIYSDNPESLVEPEVDYTDFDSIGYYNGFQYGDYSVRVGLRNDIRPDTLTAQIDKTFTHALDKYNEAINNKTNMIK